MEEYIILKEQIEKMNLSESFRDLLKQFIIAVEKNEKFKAWNLQDIIYPAIKLENLNNEDMEKIKEFIFLEIDFDVNRRRING